MQSFKVQSSSILIQKSVNNEKKIISKICKSQEDKFEKKNKIALNSLYRSKLI